MVPALCWMSAREIILHFLEAVEAMHDDEYRDYLEFRYSLDRRLRRLFV